MNSKELMRLGADLAYLSCGILPPEPAYGDTEFHKRRHEEYLDWYMHDRDIPERSDDDELREQDYRDRLRNIGQI